MPHFVVGQISQLSCGAACLLCAALELNAVPAAGDLDHGTQLYGLINGGTALAANDQWLQAIYDISGEGQQGLSMPSGVVKAAGYLGLTGTVIKAKTWTVSLLQKVYPHEIARCLPFTEQRRTGSLGNLTLAANERAIHCVRISKTVLTHWVLQRDDNSYMDPAGGPVAFDANQGGVERDSRATIKRVGQNDGGYSGTGLAVKLVKS